MERMGYGWSGDEMESLETKQTGAKRSDGISGDDLKAMLREVGEIVSGNRFEMVLRLVEFENGNKSGGASGSGSGVASGAESGAASGSAAAPKPRAKSMKLPDPETLSERMEKFVVPTEQQYAKWTDSRYKAHCGRCADRAVSTIEKEIHGDLREGVVRTR